jgi:hypothetical protein
VQVRSHVGRVEATGLKLGVEVTFNSITSLLNFIKSTNWFKSTVIGVVVHRQHGGLIILQGKVQNQVRSDEFK